MDDRAECPSIRGAREVVIDGLRDLLRREVVAEPAEQAQQLFRRQQVEQHQRVGLLGRLVVIHTVFSAARMRSSHWMFPYRCR